MEPVFSIDPMLYKQGAPMELFQDYYYSITLVDFK